VITDLKLRGSPPGQKLLFLFAMLLMLLYTVLVLFPLFNMVASSFKSTREIFLSPYTMPASFRFQNYAAVWGRGGFGRYFLNSAYVTAVSMAFVLLFGSMAAFGVSRYRYRLSTLVYMLFLSGIMLPLKAAVIPLFILIKNLGLTDRHAALVLIFTAMGLPSTVFILSGFMKTIPYELEDAARIDGCNDLRIYRTVILPLSAPSIALVTIYNAVPIWNEFFFPLVFIQTNTRKTLPLGLSTFFGQYQTDWSLLFTGLSIAIIPMILLYLFLSKYFIKGLIAGAIK
jgi:raffinose/stachyose/melibiose transport system permease protein